MALDVQVRSLRSPGQVLIQNLAFKVPDGVIHTVMGASGSGKSSLLAAICGTLPLDLQFDGDIALDGQRLDGLPTEQRRIGILFQQDLLFAHMTVFENLLFAVPATPGGSKIASFFGANNTDSTRHDKVFQGLDDLEMAAFAQADPATLSGGQRARVALMRALLAEPRALLLDEPFSKLDTALRARMRKFVFELVGQRKLPVLLVTHDDADVADASQVTRL